MGVAGAMVMLSDHLRSWIFWNAFERPDAIVPHRTIAIDKNTVVRHDSEGAVVYAVWYRCDCGPACEGRP